MQDSADDSETAGLYALAREEFWAEATAERVRLQEMRDALREEIYDTFRGVSRVGGVSWSQSAVMDNYGTQEEFNAAYARDVDTCWEELLNDPEFNPDTGDGGFAFLDPIAFRYYLAPAMLRYLRGDPVDFMLYPLCGVGAHYRECRSLLDTAQRRCFAHFLQYVVAFDSQRGEVGWDANMAEKAIQKEWWKDLAAEKEPSNESKNRK